MPRPQPRHLRRYIRGLEKEPHGEPTRRCMLRITQVNGLRTHHSSTRPNARGTNRREIGRTRDVVKLRYDRRRGTARIRKAIRRQQVHKPDSKWPDSGAWRSRHTNQTGAPTGEWAETTRMTSRSPNTGRERKSSVSRTSEEPRNQPCGQY